LWLTVPVAGQRLLLIVADGERKSLVRASHEPPSERGQLYPRDPNSTNSRTRLSALLLSDGSWCQCANGISWWLSMNRNRLIAWKAQGFAGQYCELDPRRSPESPLRFINLTDRSQSG
jgi:hypothetical protein